MTTGPARLALALVLWLLASPCAAFQEEVRALAPRPDVTQAFLLIKPDAPPVASVVLFTGGEGVAGVQRFRNPGWGQGNFLVRNRRRFAEHGFLVAVVDVPSDHATGYGTFRASKEHAQDIAAVLAELRREAAVPVWVVGTSMGTISAANAAARLKAGGPDGLVLTSSVTRKGRMIRVSLSDVDLDEVRVPTLVVHHENDGCVVTPLADARVLPRALTKAPKTEFLAFQGGSSAGNPCEGHAYHGFWGIDAEVVTAIADWMKAAR
jgi:pimeloyl-ACP methyl ester carboxylesterase